jgi:ABC-2 type transport system permease protein
MLWRAASMRLKSRLAYRADLVAGVGSGLALAAVGPIFVLAMFAHVDTLAGYTGPEILFCWGFSEAALGLFYVGFAGLYVLNRRYILGGELDRVLLRPMDPYAQILADNLAFEDVAAVASGFLLMGAAAWWGLPPVPAWRWILLAPLVLSATGVLGGIATAVASLGFHLHHRGTAVGLLMQLTSFERYPVEVFAKPLRWLITFVLPLAFAGFYPATFFLGRSEWSAFAAAQPFVAAACMAAGYAAWRVGLRRYTSAA